MTEYKGIFRVESARLDAWDYSTPWWYYVTICTKNHEQLFGDVIGEEMVLNDVGIIVEDEWLKTSQIRKNVELDYYVIMPNHLHGIVIINGKEVETHRVRLYKNDINKGDAFDASLRPVKNCLGDIIRGFKSSVTKRVRDFGVKDFTWQSRFYDRIIRNEKELYNIRMYIQQNPLKWDLEKIHRRILI